MGSLPVTNTLFTTWIVVAFLAGLAYALRRATMVPGKLQNFFELVCEQGLGLAAGIIGSEQTAKKFFSLAMTVFLFIFTANMFKMLPGVNSIGLMHSGGEAGKELIPFLRAPASDLNFTLALALISVFFIQIAGVSFLGLKRYASKFFTLRSPLYFFVGMLDIISECAKIISFSFRLFGNIFAGEVLMVVVFSFFAFLVPLPFMILEVFVGFIQAFVFAMLTVVFIKIAVSGNH